MGVWLSDQVREWVVARQDEVEEVWSGNGERRVMRQAGGWMRGREG